MPSLGSAIMGAPSVLGACRHGSARAVDRCGWASSRAPSDGNTDEVIWFDLGRGSKPAVGGSGTGRRNPGRLSIILWDRTLRSARPTISWPVRPVDLRDEATPHPLAPATSMIEIELPSGSSTTDFRPASPTCSIGPVNTPGASSAESPPRCPNTAMVTMLLPGCWASRRYTPSLHPSAATSPRLPSRRTSGTRPRKRPYHACSVSKSFTAADAKRRSTFMTSGF